MTVRVPDDRSEVPGGVFRDNTEVVAPKTHMARILPSRTRGQQGRGTGTTVQPASNGVSRKYGRRMCMTEIKHNAARQKKTLQVV